MVRPSSWTGQKGDLVKHVTTMLVTAVLGVVSLGATACNDDGADAASSAPATSPATSGSASPSTTPGAPSAAATPSSQPTQKIKVPNNRVIMIDPDGKTYTRKWIIQNAMGMAVIG